MNLGLSGTLKDSGDYVVIFSEFRSAERTDPLDSSVLCRVITKGASEDVHDTVWISRIEMGVYLLVIFQQRLAEGTSAVVYSFHLTE